MRFLKGGKRCGNLFESYLNKYNVIFLNIQRFLSRARGSADLVPYLERTVLKELKQIYQKELEPEEEHLSYQADFSEMKRWYDGNTREVFIPNQEIADEFANAAESGGWEALAGTLRASEALLVELKWNKSSEGAINQIKEKQYGKALEEYSGNLLLVGINYDTKTKKHTCVIEKAVK